MPTTIHSPSILLVCDEAVHAHAVANRTSFTTYPAQESGWQASGYIICYITFDRKTVSHVTRASGGRRSHTGRITIKVWPPSELTPVKLPSTFSKHLSRVSTGEIRHLPEKREQRLKVLIAGTSPENQETLNKVQEHVKSLNSPTAVTSGYSIMAHERDAVGVMLQLTNFNRQSMLPAMERKGKKPEHYLDVIDEGPSIRRLVEAQMLARDQHVFPGFKKWSHHISNGVQFTKSRTGEKLTILNVNTGLVEEALGVDLIYYNFRFRSYTLVQYKRMTAEHEDFVYRPIDKSYKKELSRLQDVDRLARSTTGTGELEDYRLSDDCCFFKLCPEIQQYESGHPQLIEGVYFPLSLWPAILGSKQCQGSRGGLRISYKNRPRSLNNTTFCDLVRHGWIGSRSNTTSFLDEYIDRGLQNDRSILIGLSSDLKRYAQESLLYTSSP